MIKLAGLSFLSVALMDGIGRAPAGVAQVFVGFAVGAMVIEVTRMIICSLWCEEYRNLWQPALLLAAFIPNMMALTWFVTEIHWYCLGIGFLVGFIWALVLVIGNFCNKGSEALIRAHTHISSAGG